MTKQTVDNLSETTIPELILGAASQRITHTDDLDDLVYVALLQKLPWQNQTTYANPSSLYRHYKHAVVVFDGYANDPSIKNETHQRRASSQMQRSILSQKCS